MYFEKGAGVGRLRGWAEGRTTGATAAWDLQRQAGGRSKAAACLLQRNMVDSGPVSGEGLVAVIELGMNLEEEEEEGQSRQ